MDDRTMSVVNPPTIGGDIVQEFPNGGIVVNMDHDPTMRSLAAALIDDDDDDHEKDHEKDK